MEEKLHIRCVDGIMGSGKTSWAIQEMNSHPERRYIYISPFLDEASRIVRSCEGRGFREPSSEHYGTKSRHFHRLIEKGHNISSTHRMFEGITSDVLDLLRVKNYHLILDEAISVLYDYNMGSDTDSRHWSTAHAITQTQSDVETLVEAKFLEVNEEGQVLWTGKRLSKYDKMRDLADRGTLYLVNEKALIWSFPEEVFSPGVFQTVTILSYQFDYQMMSKYLKFFNINYDKFYVEQDAEGKYFLLPYIADASHEMEFRKLLREKIHILQDRKLNAIGDPSGNRTTTMSKSWWERASDDTTSLFNKNITSFFRRVDAPANERAWSTFVSEKKDVSGKFINIKHWIPMNSRSTNRYRHKTAIVYGVNRYAHPNMVNFFSKRGLTLQHDEYATSELLQFLFRFAIREKKDVDVYIPSYRMRKLLEIFLAGGKPTDFKYEKKAT